MQKLLLGFVLLLQFGFTSVYAQTQQEMLDEQNEGFDFETEEEARSFSANEETVKKAAATEKADKAAKDKECIPKPGEYCVKIDSFQKGGEVIRGKNGVELISNYIGVIYKVAAGIIGVVAVLIVVISGIQISIGGLSPEGVNQARDRILQALLSLALLFGTALILQTVNPGFFVNSKETALLILQTVV